MASRPQPTVKHKRPYYNLKISLTFYPLFRSRPARRLNYRNSSILSSPIRLDIRLVFLKSSLTWLSVGVPGSWMSKITNGGLTRSGTGRFIAVTIHGNSGRQRFNVQQKLWLSVTISLIQRFIGHICI